MGLGQLKVQEGSSVKLYSLGICRLTLTCIFRETSRNADSSLTVFLTGDRCRLRTANSSCLSSSQPLDYLTLTVVDRPSASPFANCLLWVPFSNCLLWVPFSNCSSRLSRTCLSSPTSGRIEDLELRPLFGFAPKQTKDRLLGAPPS